MRLPIALFAAASAVLCAGAAQAASIEIKDAVARVTIVPENRSDVRVEIVRANGELPLRIRTEGDRTVVDGDLDRAIRNCRGEGERAEVHVRRVGKVPYADMPQVVIRAPRHVAVSSNGAVVGSIGRTAGLQLTSSGCSHWTVADVAGDVAIRESGIGAVRMGEADRLNIRLSGAGSIHATRVRHAMDATLSGAGGVSVQELNGSLNARVSGVGRVEVDSGRASNVTAQVSGVGGVEFGGVAESVDATVSGVGGVRVKSVTGPVRQSVSGIGKVRIGGPN